MINSQVFRLDISKNKMYRVGYLNLKFIKGDDHDPENCPDSSSTPAQVSKDLNRMINLCPWTACIIPAIFLQRWTDNIVHDQGGSPIFPNWYLPLHLGGLGIDRKFAPVHFKITRQQRKLARLFISNIDTRLYRQFNNGQQRNTIFNISTFIGCNHKTQISDIYRPLNINETEEANPWVGRLSLISDQMDLRTVRDVTYQGSFLDMYRIKPFSLDKIERLWEIKKFSTKGPQLPDLRILDHKGISFSPKKWLSSPFFVLRKVLPLL